MVLLKQMIEQVIRLHPNLKYFHIGADEVTFYLHTVFKIMNLQYCIIGHFCVCL